jgi:hypothetical protein
MMDLLSTRITATRLAGALCALAFVAGCGSETGRNLTGPSSNASPSAAGSTAVRPTANAPTVRFYKAQILPTAVASGSSTSFSVTITSCDAATCDASHVTTDTQGMKSATVVVPAGFTITSAFTVSATGGKHWDAALVSGVIQLTANPGTQKLDIGESVTVTFNATAPSLANCQSAAYEWTSVGYNSNDFVTPYTLFGSQPSVTVTAACPNGCTLTQGFWKEHYPGNWPASVQSGGLTLGTVHYTAAELESILNEPVGGNGLIDLAHQLIAAKLNIANGADGSAVATTIAAADALIGSLVVPPVGTGSLAPGDVSALVTTLDQFNQGLIGPGHCPTS